MSKGYRIEQVVSGQEALDKMTATLNKYDVGQLGLFDGVYPYVIPVNHTYREGELIIHAALTGKKADLLAQPCKVCYGVYAPVDGVVAYVGAGEVRSCQKNYESVLCYGEARLVSALKERRRYLSIFARDYRHKELMHAEEETSNCIVIQIEEMTGRYAFHPQPKIIYHYVFTDIGINTRYLTEANLTE